MIGCPAPLELGTPFFPWELLEALVEDGFWMGTQSHFSAVVPKNHGMASDDSGHSQSFERGRSNYQ